MGPSRNYAKDPLHGVSSVFDTALRTIKHPFPQLLALLAFAILVALLVLIRGCSNAMLGFGLLIAMMLIFSILGFIFFLIEMRLRYALEAEEHLKRVVREKTVRLQQSEREER
jgi:hypothetical protein